MNYDARKITLIGTGMVGMSYAYCLLNQTACDELVLIDIDRDRAAGEAMDLNHGLAFAGSHMRIWAGDYSECRDSDIVAIAAGVAQKPGEDRPSLLHRNTAVFRSIVEQVMAAGFRGIFLVASNPVDVMTRVTHTLSGLPAHQVIGTGTTLDTARLRYLLGRYFKVDPRNVHAYVMGEHGESEFVPWSQAMISTKPVLSICEEGFCPSCMADLESIRDEVRSAAGQIIAAKGATYYGIGMAMVRITRAVLGDENSILTVSAQLDGEYEQHGVFAGMPAVVGRTGIQRVLPLNLSVKEGIQMAHSCDILQGYWEELDTALT